MARELISKQIDDNVYMFQQFNTTTALKHFSTLTQLVGEPLAAALSAFFTGAKLKPGAKLKDLMKTDVDPSHLLENGLIKTVTALIASLEDGGTDRALKLIQALTSGPGVLCDNNPVIFDAHYEGNLAHLCKVIAAAIEVQYGNFFSAVTAKLPVRPAAAPIGVR